MIEKNNWLGKPLKMSTFSQIKNPQELMERKGHIITSSICRAVFPAVATVPFFISFPSKYLMIIYWL